MHFEHEVLEAVAGEPSGAMTVGEIQELTQVTTRSVVRILARLRAAGWVTVEWDADPLAPPAASLRKVSASSGFLSRVPTSLAVPSGLRK